MWRSLVITNIPDVLPLCKMCKEKNLAPLSSSKKFDTAKEICLDEKEDEDEE